MIYLDGQRIRQYIEWLARRIISEANLLVKFTGGIDRGMVRFNTR
jgi:methylaspartate ammonia-lyase